MKRKRTSEVFVILGLAGCLTIPAYGAAWDCWWVHPCDETNLTCRNWNCCPLTCTSYFCEADWDVSDNWGGIACTGFPDSSTESAIIKHSNTGSCDGGTNDGRSCSEDNDCPPNPPEQSPATCENVEDNIVIEIPTVTIESLRIETKSTSATSESLSIDFIAKDPGGNTLTSGLLKVVATNGPAGAAFKSGAKLEVGSVSLVATNGTVAIRGAIKTDQTD